VTDTSLIGRDGRTDGRVCPSVAVTTLVVGRYFFISILFKHSLRKVETFIILVILVFELTHVRFLYGFLNKGVDVVRLMFRTAID
jgi:hypothetical protein